MMLRRWYRQAAHIAAAELLRRQHGPHDLIIRARIDTTFAYTEHLPIERLSPRRIFAAQIFKYHPPESPRDSQQTVVLNASDLGVRPPACMAHSVSTMPVSSQGQMRSCTLYWTDWLYAGSEAAMSAAFMRMVDPRQLMVFADRAFRCDGLCPEEQMVLQLRAQGMDVEALSWTLCLNKIPFRPTRIAPLIPRSETCLRPGGMTPHA
mmetsp:Transcript_12939/g.29529  ORF Transcript_12939/g.29529 Transcript_12939/m.29529 type:complete len:207 (-) Transcript_12939:86-706(-)